MSDQRDSKLLRRQFLQQAAAATAGFTIVLRHVLAGSGQSAPSDRFTSPASASAAWVAPI